MMSEWKKSPLNGTPVPPCSTDPAKTGPDLEAAEKDREAAWTAYRLSGSREDAAEVHAAEARFAAAKEADRDARFAAELKAHNERAAADQAAAEEAERQRQAAWKAEQKPVKGRLGGSGWKNGPL
jgi:hypothetical protein